MLPLLAWRFIQNIRGEVVVLFSIGDDWNGEESVLSAIFQVVCGLVIGILVADGGASVFPILGKTSKRGSFLPLVIGSSWASSVASLY